MYSQKYLVELRPEQQAAVKATLPLSRVPGEDPATRSGSTTSGNSYSRNGVGVARDIFTAF
jgi:hypothetical protein